MANLGFIGFMTIVLVVGLIALLIFALRRIYGEKEDPRNEEYVINLLSDYTDGYGLLLVKEKESNKDLIHITGSPRDLDYIKLKDKDFILKEQDLFVRKDLFIPIGNSTHRKINIAFPDKPEQIPEEMKQTKFGELAMKFIESQNEKSKDQKVEEIQDKNKLILRKKDEGLQSAENLVTFHSNSLKEILKSQTVPVKKENE